MCSLSALIMAVLVGVAIAITSYGLVYTFGVIPLAAWLIVFAAWVIGERRMRTHRGSVSEPEAGALFLACAIYVGGALQLVLDHWMRWSGDAFYVALNFAVITSLLRRSDFPRAHLQRRQRCWIG